MERKLIRGQCVCCWYVHQATPSEGQSIIVRCLFRRSADPLGHNIEHVWIIEEACYILANSLREKMICSLETETSWNPSRTRTTWFSWSNSRFAFCYWKGKTSEYCPQHKPWHIERKLSWRLRPEAWGLAEIKSTSCQWFEAFTAAAANAGEATAQDGKFSLFFCSKLDVK